MISNIVWVSHSKPDFCQTGVEGPLSATCTTAENCFILRKELKVNWLGAFELTKVLFLQFTQIHNSYNPYKPTLIAYSWTLHRRLGVVLGILQQSQLRLDSLKCMERSSSRFKRRRCSQVQEGRAMLVASRIDDLSDAVQSKQQGVLGSWHPAVTSASCRSHASSGDASRPARISMGTPHKEWTMIQEIPCTNGKSKSSRRSSVESYATPKAYRPEDIEAFHNGATPNSALCRSLFKLLDRAEKRQQHTDNSDMDQPIKFSLESGGSWKEAAGKLPCKPQCVPVRLVGDNGRESVGNSGLCLGKDKELWGRLRCPRNLDHYLPEGCCKVFREAGLKDDLYDWQAKCLCQPGVMDGRNLIYCAPTSGGKSLVYEILALKKLTATRKVSMVVLPFVTLCSQKASRMTKLLAPLGKNVRSFYGTEGSSQTVTPDTGVLVCTIEKANLLITRMIEESSLDKLGLVIVDELHMVGDKDRGYLLELLLSKLQYCTASCPRKYSASNNALRSDSGTANSVQIVGTSATLPNGKVLAKWLNAVLYETDFRPVKLNQYIKIGRCLKDDAMELVRELPVDADCEQKDPDHVAFLTREIVQEGQSVLIFCASKKACEVCAKQLQNLVTIPEQVSNKRDSKGGFSARESVVNDLKRVPAGAHPLLQDLVQSGFAFHHAGLSSEERDVVESAYKSGAVSVLTATSTLAAGVNLPARRVILRHPYIGIPSNCLDATRYQQMSGRAGRAGIDTYGDSILIATSNSDIGQLKKLVKSKVQPIESCLAENAKGFHRALLEVIATGHVRTANDVAMYTANTLLGATKDLETVVVPTVRSSLEWLCRKDLIRWEESEWHCTALGQAAASSGLDPYQALSVYEDLSRARTGFVFTTELHLTYLISPEGDDFHINWEHYYTLFDRLSRAESSVAEYVGVNVALMLQLSVGQSFKHLPERSSVHEEIRICRRFYSALILRDVIEEVPIPSIVERFGISKGSVQNLQDRAGRFAVMVAAFCERLGWHDLEALVANFQGRVTGGVRPEIVTLTEIPFVKAHRARLMFKAGLQSIQDVAEVEDPDKLAAILNKGCAQTPQWKIDQLAARQIIKGARGMLARRAQELKHQVQTALHAVNGRSEVGSTGHGYMHSNTGSTGNRG